MTKSAVTTLIARYPAAYITKKLRMTQGLLAEGSALVAKNPVGWLRRAIEEDYKPPRSKVRPTPASDTKSHKSTGIPEEQQREQNTITPPVELPQPDRQTERIWEQTIECLKNELPAGETADRLTGTMLIEVTETKAVIFVPNRTAGAWLERRLYGQIAKALKAVIGKDEDLQFHFSFVGTGVGLGLETRLTGTRLLEVLDTATYIGVPDRGNRCYLERRLYQVFYQAVKAVLGRKVDLQFLSLAPTFP